MICKVMKMFSFSYIIVTFKCLKLIPEQLFSSNWVQEREMEKRGRKMAEKKLMEKRWKVEAVPGHSALIGERGDEWQALVWGRGAGYPGEQWGGTENLGEGKGEGSLPLESLEIINFTVYLLYTPFVKCHLNISINSLWYNSAWEKFFWVLRLK